MSPLTKGMSRTERAELLARYDALEKWAMNWEKNRREILAVVSIAKLLAFHGYNPGGLHPDILERAFAIHVFSLEIDSDRFASTRRVLEIIIRKLLEGISSAAVREVLEFLYFLGLALEQNDLHRVLDQLHYRLDRLVGGVVQVVAETDARSAMTASRLFAMTDSRPPVIWILFQPDETSPALPIAWVVNFTQWKNSGGDHLSSDELEG